MENNRAENSLISRRDGGERKMQRFKMSGFSPEVSFPTHTPPSTTPLTVQRHLTSAQTHRMLRAAADGHMADRSRSGLTILEAATLRARTAT